jgi:hypothetical protein
MYHETLIGPGTKAQGKQLFETKSRLSRMARETNTKDRRPI